MGAIVLGISIIIMTIILSTVGSSQFRTFLIDVEQKERQLTALQEEMKTLSTGIGKKQMVVLIHMNILKALHPTIIVPVMITDLLKKIDPIFVLYTPNLYNTKTGSILYNFTILSIFSEGQLSLHYFWMQSLLK